MAGFEPATSTLRVRRALPGCATSRFRCIERTMKVRRSAELTAHISQSLFMLNRDSRNQLQISRRPQTWRKGTNWPQGTTIRVDSALGVSRQTVRAALNGCMSTAAKSCGSTYDYEAANVRSSADSDGPMLPAALWRPGRLALCLYMFRGVILRSAGLLGCPRWLFMRGADKGTGSNFSRQWGSAC